MYFEEVVTLEDKAHSNPCFGCLSTNRKLLVLGDNAGVFCKLFENEHSLKASEVMLCWECTAVLRKVKLFKEKVDHAQTLLSNKLVSQINESPDGLSNLKLSKIEKTNYDNATVGEYFIKCDDDMQLDIDIKDETPDEYLEPEYGDDELNNDSDYETNNYEGLNVKTKEIVLEQDITNKEPRKFALTAERRVLYGIDVKDINKISTSKRKKKTNVKSDIQIEFENEEMPIENVDKSEEDPDFRCIIHKTKPQSNNDKKETTNNKNKKPYKSIHNKVGFTPIPLPLNKVVSWMEKDRNSEYFTTPNKLNYNCELCLKIFPNEKGKINIHKISHRVTKDRPLQCEYCKVRLSTASQMSRTNHIQKYHSNILKCNTCDFKCYSECYMEIHIKIHRTSLQCQDCMGRFETKNKFFEHFCICDLCSKRCKTKQRLQHHMIKIHMKHTRHYVSGGNGRVAGHEDAYCVTCDKQFPERKHYEQHLKFSKLHANEWPNERKLVKKTHPCIACDKVLSRAGLLRQHYDRIHLNVPVPRRPRVQCQYQGCGKLVGILCSTAASLRDHNSRVHLNLPIIRPHKERECQSCGKTFKKLASLNQHIKYKHFGIRNHACDYCEQRFFTKQILANHIRTHTGERPFHCEHCDAKFAQRIAMRQHVKFIHMKARREIATSSYQGPSYE